MEWCVSRFDEVEVESNWSVLSIRWPHAPSMAPREFTVPHPIPKQPRPPRHRTTNSARGTPPRRTPVDFFNPKCLK
ncbi:hypothetical protein AAHA92_08289 [Salvia divinorum]|uniref:Uncharacterized protein n=1 Tax=Salvia divinorum TaxID=28513 RepID=A0ABD1HNT0_SALDI